MVMAAGAAYHGANGSERLSQDSICAQDHISHILGVRREGGANAALALQRRNLINYVRGRITILNRAGLEAGSCECYEIVKLDVLPES